MKKYTYKTAASFRKAHPDFIEFKENTGKKKISVFIDPDYVMGRGLPTDVQDKFIQQLREQKDLRRTQTLYIGKPIVSEIDGLEYFIHVDCMAFNVRNKETGKLLYTVLQIDQYRYVAYKMDIYGVFEGFPVKSDTDYWSQKSLRFIADLYYEEEEK